MRLHQLPLRVTTGAYTLHSGLEKWKAGEETATAVHGMAAGTYPFLADIPAPKFLRYLAAGEIALGAALLMPRVPARVVGAALSGFSGGLLGLYVRTPGLRKPGSIWPTSQGTGISKDVWMLGIGLALLAERHENRSTSGS